MKKGCVLLVQYSSNQDGSAFSGLLLADGLAERGWETHIAFGFDGPIIEWYQEAGHTTHVVPHKSWLRREQTPQFIKDFILEVRNASSFVRLIDDIQPSVVYLNTAVSLAGGVAAWVRCCPLVWHLREMLADVGGEMHVPGWALPVVRSLFLRGATRLVANSEATAINLLGDKASHHAAIIPNAVRADFFKEKGSHRAARKVLQMPLDGPLIGVPGTLRPMKGHEFFLRAIEPLLEKDASLHIAITGGTEGRYAKQVIQQSNDVAGSDRIHFTGWVKDMPLFYRACDIICVPSRAEPFGRTVIEAFAAGTPVVATAVGGMKEIVDSGTTGLLVSYGDEEALSDAIRRLLDTPELRQEMKTSARKVAEEKYHEQVYKKRIASIVGAFLSDE